MLIKYLEIIMQMIEVIPLIIFSLSILIWNIYLCFLVSKKILVVLLIVWIVWWLHMINKYNNKIYKSLINKFTPNQPQT
jgi:TM2 domain-containing membrane protein YozV